MRALLCLEIREFLDSCSLKYDFRGDCFFLPDSSLLIVPVILKGDYCRNEVNEVNEVKRDISAKQIGNLRQIRIYEDLWFTKGDIIRNRLRALLGKGEVVFARKCRVAKIDTPIAREFLDNNHILGYSRAKYFYGLFYSQRIYNELSDLPIDQSNELIKERLVAVASFSAGRPMKRDRGVKVEDKSGDKAGDKAVVSSYEWVRYASVGSTRVVGGMGRLLNAFVEHERPQEVMSYADSDWDKGNAYLRLGFELIGKTPPVKFMVDPKTYERYSLKKLLKDRKYQQEDKYSDLELDQNQLILLLNSGNFKFLRSFSFL